MTKVTPLIFGLMILTPIMIAFGQILFKMTGDKLATTGAPFYTSFYDPIFISSLALYGLATLLWIYVLKTAPLSYAYPFMALSFVIVPLLAAFYLKEPVTLKYAFGTGLIVLGLIIAQT